MSVQRQDLARTLFALVAIGALTLSSLWILLPFIGPAIWAATVVVATWPLLMRLQRLFGGRRWPATTLLVTVLTLVFVVPLAAAVGTLVAHGDRLVEWTRRVAEWRLPSALPETLTSLPGIGALLTSAWASLVELGLEGLAARLSPYAGTVTRWFAAQAGDMGVLLVQFLVTLVLAALLYARGEDSASFVSRLAARIAGDRGTHAVARAGLAVRGVAISVGLTALLQAATGGLGLALAGVPFAGLLTAVMVMLCLAQLGPLLVLVPATIWLFWGGHVGAGLFLAAWSAVAGTMDNVLRPWLGRLAGDDTPLLLNLAGVIGGMVAFGLVGIIVGPVILAVAFALLQSWVGEGAAAVAEGGDEGGDEPPTEG